MISGDHRYLLRLWCDGDDGEAWRATLRDLENDDTRHFASIRQLVSHLAELTGKEESSSADDL